MSPLIKIVYLKEMTDALRDKRAMQTWFLFVALFPFVVFMMLNTIISKASKAENETIDVVVINGSAAPTLLTYLENNTIKVNAHDGMDEAAITALLAERKMAAVIRFDKAYGQQFNNLRPADIELWFDSAAEQDRKTRKIQRLLRSYSSDIAQSRLMVRGVSPALLSPIAVQEYDTATQASRAGKLVGVLLGTLFVYVFYYCLNTTIDSTAGERERKSLEILLAQPARAFDLIVGKWLTSATISFAGITLAMVAGHLILKQMALEEIGMSWRLTTPDLIALLLISLPLCLFAPAFEIALALNSKTFKEAQTMVSFALLIPLLGVIVVPMLDITTQTWMYAIPVLAEQTLLMEFAKGNSVGALPIVLTMSMSLVLTVACIAFATKRLQSERFVVGI